MRAATPPSSARHGRRVKLGVYAVVAVLGVLIVMFGMGSGKEQQTTDVNYDALPPLAPSQPRLPIPLGDSPAAVGEAPRPFPPPPAATARARSPPPPPPRAVAVIGPRLGRDGHDCPLTFRQRQHQENHYFDNTFGWTYGSEWDSTRLADTQYNPPFVRMALHRRVTRNLTTVPDDFMDRIREAPLPVVTTVRSTQATFDLVTYDAAFQVAEAIVPFLALAVDTATGMVIDRSSYSVGATYSMLIGHDVHVTTDLARNILSTLKDRPTHVIELPPTDDGYFWAVDWFHQKPGHFLDCLAQLFAGHYEHYLKTGKNATMIFMDVNAPDHVMNRYNADVQERTRQARLLYNEWVPFIRRHYPVDVTVIPFDTKLVNRANITFAIVADVGIRPSCARFFGDVIAPRVLEWCAADPTRCRGDPFVDSVKFDGDGGPRSDSPGARRFRQRAGLATHSRGDSLEHRVYALATADVAVVNWGGGVVLASYMLGGYMPEKYLPWPRRSIDSMHARMVKARPDNCPAPRPQQRFIAMGSARNKDFYAREMFEWSYLYGRRHPDVPGYKTPSWYVTGEELGHVFLPGAIVKVEWFGTDGDKWFADAGTFDDAAFRLDDATMQALEESPESNRELLADDELFDHLLRTHRVMLMNQWIALSNKPAHRCVPTSHEAASPSSSSSSCNDKALRGFPDSSWSTHAGLTRTTPVLFLSPAALDGEPVLGESPSSKGMVVARRTTGTARYFAGGTSDALRQSTARVARWGRRAPSYANVVARLVLASRRISGVIVQPKGAASHGIAVPNSHPCLGMVSELAIPEDPLHCAEVYRGIAVAFGSVDVKGPISDSAVPPGSTVVWLVPTLHKDAIGEVVQSVLSRLGHLALEGTLTELTDAPQQVFAVLPATLSAFAIAAVKDILALFGIPQVAILEEGSTMTLGGVRVVVAPPLEGFRDQFTAQQFAATRWLERNRPVPAFASVGPEDPRHSTVLATLGYDYREYAPLLEQLSEAFAARNVTHLEDPMPSAMSRLFRTGLTSLAIFYGDSILYFASMWADALRRGDGAEAPQQSGWGESGRRARLNLLIICVPMFWKFCHLGQDLNSVDQRSRFYSNGREFNLPRGVHVKYIMVTAPDVRASWPHHMPMSLKAHLELGWLNFHGVPRTEREFGTDPEQSQADLQRVQRAFLNATRRT